MAIGLSQQDIEAAIIRATTAKREAELAGKTEFADICQARIDRFLDQMNDRSKPDLVDSEPAA